VASRASRGRIIESNQTISVNNPAAIRSWQRAKRWIGWISPRSVLAYQELDSMNAFDQGEAAFVASGVALHYPRRSIPPSALAKFSGAEQNRLYEHSWGQLGWAGTLGGSGLAVSQHSSHRKEAIELIRFLIRAQIASNQVEESAVANQSNLQSLSSILNAGRNPEEAFEPDS